VKTILLTLFIAGSWISSFAQWTTVNSKTTEDLTAVTVVDSNTGFACGAYNTLLKTTNGGNSWQAIPNSGVPLASYMSVEALDANHLFIAMNGLYTSDNGGSSFSQWGTFNSSAYAIQNIHAVNDSTVIITKGGYILRSTNKGGSWSNVYYNEHLAGRMLFTGGGDTAYTASGITFDGLSEGSIHKSVDGGTAWYDLNLGSRQVIAMCFRSSWTGYYVDYGNTLYKTIDGGTTWTELSRPVDSASDYITDVLFLNNAVGYVCTVGGYIYKTTNGGSSWAVDHPAGKTNSAALSRLVKLSDLQVIAIGNSGTILKMGKTLSTKDVERSRVAVCPNPASSYLDVTLGEYAGRYRYLELYNALGALVIKTEVEAGQLNYRLDLARLSKGIYLFKASGNVETSFEKIVIR
jgi:photosystem II stability/assembly factor-like uncharacterized protein